MGSHQYRRFCGYIAEGPMALDAFHPLVLAVMPRSVTVGLLDGIRDCRKMKPIPTFLCSLPHQQTSPVKCRHRYPQRLISLPPVSFRHCTPDVS